MPLPHRRRAVAAAAFAAAIVASAPFAQQLFAYVDRQYPAQSGTLVRVASIVPVALVAILAIRRIRDRRVLRYALGALGIALGAAYIRSTELAFTEAFHFTEYGALAVLSYRVWIGVDDWSIVGLPLLAGALVGTIDEWVQWFIPIRAGEMRDVLINVVATACGLLVAVAIDTPPRVRLALDRRSRASVARWAGAAAAAFALFFYSVHVGYDVHDPDIGSFRSTFTAEGLARAARDRTARWQREPPVEGRLLWREDHYLTEAIWHVRQRNEAWESGDVATAWRENRILETFFTPVLSGNAYADSAGHRWAPGQRADAAARVGGKTPPAVTTEYAVPLYTWPAWF
jgi:VanZ family protein